MIWKWLTGLFDRGRDKFTYGILKKCDRCTYAKSYEPILIFSKSRGPRIIMVHRPTMAVYVRHEQCTGFSECGKCFEAVEDCSEYPCLWVKL